MSAQLSAGVQTLFTPWRYSYLTSPKREQSCIFCDAAKTRRPADSLLLFRDENALVMLNRFPYTNGHIMVAPRDHSARLFESTDPILFTVIRLTAEAQRILSDTYQPEGFNIGMNFGKAAGAGFADHYHVHIVPRWGGDQNFMGVVSDTRMVPEELDVTWKRLRPKFQNVKIRLSDAG